MNINNPTTFGTPTLTLSTSNSSGTGGALRSDDTILVYDTTNPTTIAYAASPAVGSSSTSSRRDHTHGMASGVGIAQAWCQITAAGALSSPSHNIASVTDVTTGQRQIVFDTDFTNLVYAPVGALDDGGSDVRNMRFADAALGLTNLSIQSFDATSDVDRPTGQAFYGAQ